MKLNFKINKPIDVVFEHLTNMEKFVKVHPIIYKMEKIGSGTYLVHEKLKMVFIPINFKYTAVINSNANNRTIHMNATIMKRTNVDMHYSLRTDGNFTYVSEEVIYRSPLPLIWLMQMVFKKQHSILFRNMEKMN